MTNSTKPNQRRAGKGAKNQSFSAQLQKMHPNEVGALLMRIDAKIAAEPNNPKPFFDKGLALMRLKMFREAVETFKKSIDLNPDNPAVHFQIANAFLEMGQLQLARKGYEKSISINPKSSIAYHKLSVVLNRMGKIMDALEKANKSLSLDPQKPNYLMHLGHLYVHLIRLDEGREFFEKALELDPQSIEIKQAIYNVERLKGNKEEAKKLNNKILKDHPTDARALRSFSELNKDEVDENFVERLENNLLYNDYIDPARSELYFALGDVLEKIGNIEKSFKAYCQGNLILSRIHNYNENAELMGANTTKQFFRDNKKFVNKELKLKEYNFKPIFIIGMPRSGTSLTEQIISSHSKVFGAGELELMGKAVAEGRKTLTKRSNITFEEFERQISVIRETYYEEVLKQGVTSTFFTDKMMYNFKFVGYIKCAFPEAKIVNVRRHPMAICWSIFKHFLNGKGHAYKTTEKTLSDYFLIYRDLIDFWKSELKDPFYSLIYERLTEDQEAQSKYLLDYCNLEWEEQCINFHKSERVVRTFSNDQVRKKMYSGSSEAWKKYADHFSLLLDRLAKENEEHEAQLK